MKRWAPVRREDKPRALIFCRTGLERKPLLTGQSLEEQEQRCTQHAEERGYRIVKILKEISPGTRLVREDLEHILDGARKKEFDVVIVSRLDRFHRDVRHAWTYEYILRDLGVDIETVGTMQDVSGSVLLEAELAARQAERGA